MPSLDTFCARMRFWCDEADLGYNQANRWDIRQGGECDCSSLVIHALHEAGFNIGDSTYTGNLSTNLCENGWYRVEPDGNPQKGDILLNDKNHVAVWLGDCLAQASIDERGNIAGGQAGDQTGRETHTRSYYNYPWDCYLRWGGDPSHEGDDDMKTEALFYCDDTHSGYKKGDIVYWSPEAGFNFLEHPDCVQLIKQCNPKIAEIHSSKKASWLERARQATNPMVADSTFGKRN